MKARYFVDIWSVVLLFAPCCLGFQGIDLPARRPIGKLSASVAAANNVVLSPGEDVAAFDSLKIGGARVHRYSRENDPEAEETEYVMWFHGRSVEQDEDKKLPPLSTGRIGRATSRNGLLWKKDVSGSPSEDAPDCCLGLNKESWWGFDTAHVGLGSVLLPVSTPAVITEGGVYLMYYMGGSFEETDLAQYIDKDVGDAKIAGMTMRIGVGVSQDGKTWGRVEGDHPSGACMVPYVKDDPSCRDMIDDDTKVSNLQEELYCGWPEVVVDITPEKSGFLMYYSSMTKHDKQKKIGYAVSEDGFRWRKRGICLEPDSNGMDDAGCARCNVLRNAVFSEPEGWKESSGYTMYYEGVSSKDGKHRVLEAKSMDGQSWTKSGVVLEVGMADAWDSEGVGSPNVLRMDDGSLRMYYTGQGSGGKTAVGVAKLEHGSNEWVREQASITFADA